MSLPLYVEPSPQMSTPCSVIAFTSIVPVTARGRSEPAPQLRLELRRRRRVGARDEDRVVARDRAGDLREPRGIERVGERGRVPAWRLDDEDRSGRGGGAQVLPQRRAELVEATEGGRAGRCIHELPLAVTHLRQPELRDVTRHGRLPGVQ